MADRGVINETPFAVQELYLADEEGRDLLAVVVQATYDLRAGTPLALAEEQVPIAVAGTYNGEPGISSYRYEPQVAPFKPATDVVLIGHAYASHPGATQVDVGFQVGPIIKGIRVFGDRRWYRRMGFETISDPLPFETIPLLYERAFGGWDRSPDDPERHTVDARNPVGTGYHHKKHSRFVEGAPLPNLEDARQLIKSYVDAPTPAGFGFIGPEWTPRAQYAGTYDEAWMQRRMPLLPEDFDRRFFQAAPPGQIAPGYLKGDEQAVLVQAVPEGRLAFSLPGEPPPRCTIIMKDQAMHTPQAHLDTVVLDTDARQVLMIWRAHQLVPGGRLHDLRAIRIEPDPASVHAQQAGTAVFLS